MFESHSFFFQAEDGIRDTSVTGVQTCALPIYRISPLVTLSPCHPVIRYTARIRLTSFWIRTRLAYTPSCSISRSEERRVGKECRSRGGRDHGKEKNNSDEYDVSCTPQLSRYMS